jgi:hypothetical protein
MLRRRKVLTRNQYEKRRQRRQFVESVCDASPPRQFTNRGTLPLTSPESNGFQKADEALEIYHGNHRSHKRGRPLGLNQFHSPTEASLCYSSKSSYTDSDAASPNLSDDIFSNEETAPSIQSYESVGDAISPVARRNIRDRPFTVEMARISVNVSRRTGDQAIHRKNLHTEKSKALNAVGAKAGEFLWCCGNSFFFFTKQTTSNIIQGPGISVAEERKLRHLTRKGNFPKDRLPPSSSNVSESKEIDQIEVIPVDENFQSAGSVSYAEMENTGMVFAPNTAIDSERLLSSIPLLPWWKRENWTASSHAVGVHSQDISQGRTSAYTKKVSNCRTPITRQMGELHHSSFCTLHEDKAPQQQSTGADNNAWRFSDSEEVRPFQAFNPKIEDSKKMRKYNNRDVVSDGSMSFTESVNDGKKNRKRIQFEKAPVVVETVRPENGSEIESETDLSEMIRKRDISQVDRPMTAHFHTDPDSSVDDENDAVFHALAAGTLPIEYSMKTDTAERQICERDDSNHHEQSRSTHQAEASVLDGRSLLNLRRDDTRTSAPIRARNPRIEKTSDIDVVRQAVDRSPPSGQDKMSTRTTENSGEIPQYHYERGRQNDFIDLTNHDEPCMSTRKRSKSPIRLYGDPPFPYRMDGSPVRGRQSCFWPEDAMDQEIPNNDFFAQLDAVESLQNITMREYDEILNATGTRSPNMSALIDGSKIVMLKPIVNVYKIEATDQQRVLEVSKKFCHNESPVARSHSKKVDLQIRTVFSDRENNDDPAAELYASPLITVSLEDDERSVDDELRKLAASEKLLRKELEEIQKRSAERRWELEIEGTTENDKSAQRQHAVNTPLDINDVGSPPASANIAPSVIDVSCIDLDFDQSQSLVSSLPIASAYRETDKNENEDFLSQVPCVPTPKEYKMDQLNVEEWRTIQSKINLSPVCTSQRNMALASGLYDTDTSSKWVHSNDRENLCVPSFSNHIPIVQPGIEKIKDDSIFSGICQDEVFSASNIRGNTERGEHDVLIDKDFSWRAIEDLYLLAARSMSESPSQRGTISKERDIAILRRQASREFPMSLVLHQAVNYTEPVQVPSALAIEQNDIHGREENDGNKPSSLDVAALDTYNAEQSLYASLLHFSPKNTSYKEKPQTVRCPDSSPRLESLLHRHKHLMMGGNSAATSTVFTNQHHAENKDGQTQGIYGELVRRIRLNNRKSFVTNNSCSLENDIHMTPTFGMNRLALQSSSSKRLERQKKLHMEMQARRQSEHQNHLSMRLSPARRRASKSLRRNQSLFNEPTASMSTKNMVKLTSTLQQPGGKCRPNKGAVVEYFMPVTGDSPREFMKKKKGSDYNSRDLSSIASSARSKDLVQSLPSVAKTRNAAAGKPGRSVFGKRYVAKFELSSAHHPYFRNLKSFSLLWEASAGRES